MSATSTVEAIYDSVPDPVGIQGTEAEALIVGVWRFNQVVQASGLLCFIEHDPKHQILQLEFLLQDAPQPILRDLWRLLSELIAALEKFMGDDWRYDELFLSYLLELEDHFLLFNVEELCQALLEHSKTL